MEQNEIRETLVRLETKLDDYERRLGDLEHDRAAIAKLCETMAEIKTEQSHLINKVDALNIKVDELEKRPAKRWDALVAAVISAIVGLAAGFLIKG